MQDKDKAMKDFESYPDVAADIINALVYEDVEEYECLDGKINIFLLAER